MHEIEQKPEYASISHSIKRFIQDHFPTARRRPLEDTDPLIEKGIIDSLGVLDVVAFIESEFKLTVEDDDLVPENFRNVATIAAYVERKRSNPA